MEYLNEPGERALDSETYLHSNVSADNLATASLHSLKASLLGEHGYLLFLRLMNFSSYFLEKGHACVCQHQRVTGNRLCIFGW